MIQNQIEKLLSSGTTFLTFAGVETHLLFQQKFPLREFSAFEIFEDEDAWRTLQDEFLRPAADAAAATGSGLITDCLVWRASADYVARLGYEDGAVAEINRRAVQRIRGFVRSWQAGSERARGTPLVLSADVGPRGDGYAIDSGGAMDVDAALDYHRRQMRVLSECEVDLVSALTITSVSEAAGIARAAEESGLPLVMSPTVRDRRPFTRRLNVGQVHRIRGRGHRRVSSALHGQLRAPNPLGAEPWGRRSTGRGMARPFPWVPRQRVGQEPRGARQQHQSRPRGPGVARDQDGLDAARLRSRGLSVGAVEPTSNILRQLPTPVVRFPASRTESQSVAARLGPAGKAH